MAATDQMPKPNNPLAMQEPSIHGPRELPADAPPVRAPLATANDMPHDAGYRCRVSRGLDGFSPDPLTDLLRHGARQLAVMFASGELTFADGLVLRREIEEDLASFTITTSAAGNQIITQSRSAAGHGDLGISLALAAFTSQHLKRGVIGQHKLAGYY